MRSLSSVAESSIMNLFDFNWIQNIPASWSLARADRVFTRIDVRSADGDEDLLSVSERDGVRLRSAKAVTMFQAESYAGHKLCWPGDLVINSLWAWSRGLGFSKHHGIVSTAYSVFRPDTSKYSVKYLDYLLRTKEYVRQYLIASRGVWISRLLLNDWVFLRIPILSPPLQTQTRIANFLDEKTALIDKAIAQKQQLISLLEERRQILIHQAVTRGLDPDVELRDSGLEWIGKVPKHWEVKKLKFVSSTSSGSTPDSSRQEIYYNGTIPWVRTMDIDDNIVLSVPVSITELAVRDTACKVLPIDTVCVAMYGGAGSYGKHGLLKFSGAVNQAICAIISGSLISPEFLYYQIKDRRKYWTAVANGARKDPNIGQSDVQNVVIPVPLLQEQVKIVKGLKELEQTSSNVIGKVQAQINKLKEYKSTLINSAVTGQIEV